MKLATVALTVMGLGALMAPANAMHCSIANQPELTQVCNQVLSVVCGNPKLGPCG